MAKAGLPNYEQPGNPPGRGLIKPRDLPANIWNVDPLVLLSNTVDQATKLARLIGVEELGRRRAGTRGFEGGQPTPGTVPRGTVARVGLV